MIKVIHDSQFYSLKEIIEQGSKLKGTIIETFNVDTEKHCLFLVVDTDSYASYLDLETLEVYESLDFDRVFGYFDFLLYKEPYIEVKLRKMD